MADPNQQPEKPVEEQSLIGGIFRDCVDTILVPKSKEILTNVLTDGVYAFADFFVQVAQRRVWKNGQPYQSSSSSRPTRTPYADRYEKVNKTGQATQSQPSSIGNRSSTKLQYIVFRDQSSAETMRLYLVEQIEKCGHVTVAAFYQKYNDLIDPNVDPNDPTKKSDKKLLNPIFNDFNFGWTKKEDIHYVRNRDGYWFNLPTPTQVIHLN